MVVCHAHGACFLELLDAVSRYMDFVHRDSREDIYAWIDVLCLPPQEPVQARVVASGAHQHRVSAGLPSNGEAARMPCLGRPSAAPALSRTQEAWFTEGFWGVASSATRFLLHLGPWQDLSPLSRTFCLCAPDSPVP